MYNPDNTSNYRNTPVQYSKTEGRYIELHKNNGMIRCNHIHILSHIPNQSNITGWESAHIIRALHVKEWELNYRTMEDNDGITQHEISYGLE